MLEVLTFSAKVQMICWELTNPWFGVHPIAPAERIDLGDVESEFHFGSEIVIIPVCGMKFAKVRLIDSLWYEPAVGLSDASVAVSVPGVGVTLKELSETSGVLEVVL